VSIAVTILTQICLVLMTTFGAIAWRTMDRMDSRFGTQLQQVVAASQGNSVRLERIEERIGSQGLYERLLSEMREDMVQLREELKALGVRILELEKRR